MQISLQSQQIVIVLIVVIVVLWSLTAEFNLIGTIQNNICTHNHT